MIALTVLIIMMAMGVMQYSLEKGHPRFVIILELLTIAASTVVLVVSSTVNYNSSEQEAKNIIKNKVDSAYISGYKKGLKDCNKK